jgi:hypothetical protein
LRTLRIVELRRAGFFQLVERGSFWRETEDWEKERREEEGHEPFFWE